MKYISFPFLFCLLFYFTYNLKTELGIKLPVNTGHFPSLLEKDSYGLIQCKWFANPHHCK